MHENSLYGLVHHPRFDQFRLEARRSLIVVLKASFFAASFSNRIFFFQTNIYNRFTMLSEKSENEISDYFRSNLLAVRQAVNPNDFKKFAALNNNGARVNFILNYPEAHCLPLEVENIHKKDLDKAIKLKDAGNKFFGLGHYLRALETYSNAILLAPRKDLGIFLANRSAALHNMGRHDLALSDVEECLRVGYPKELLYKVEERKARCLLALENHPKAIEAFRKTLQALDYAKIPLERKQKIDMDVRVMLAVMEKGNQLGGKKGGKLQKPAVQPKKILKNENETKPIPRITDINPLYPSCSKAVEIRDEGGVIGRHAIATRDISPGELLVVEKPHSAILLGEYRLSHCQMCFTRNVAPYPAACDVCDLVAYCSVRCRDAHAKIHANECELLEPLWLSQASVTCLMALKSITQCPFPKLYKMKEDIENRNYEISESRPYSPKDYLALHGLITHEDERVADDLFHRAYIAAWLLRLLKRSNYFPENVKTLDVGGQDLTAEEKYIGGLLLHNLQLLPFNAHEISELTRKKGETTLAAAKSIFIGGGIYPTVALFNHSCNPGIIRYFNGTTMVVRAIRTITAGSEICENYGPIFTMTDETERKRRLRVRYWFDCGCEACAGHWPLLENIDPRILRFKCDTGPSCGNILPVNTDSNEFMISCKKCGKSTNIFKGLKALQDTDALFKVASRHLEADRCENALKSYLEILKLLDETLALPIRDYHLSQQGVRLCMLTFGNTSVI